MIEATEERKEQLKVDMQRLLKEWQERLFLQGWIINLKMVDQSEIAGKWGENAFNWEGKWCDIRIAYPDAERICFQVSDDGCGIPGEIIRLLNRDVSVPSASEQPPGAPHIMGLRIVCQIFQAHGWTIRFTDNHTIHIWPGKEPEQPS